MDHSTPDLPVPYHLLELAQVHVHCISDAIQPSHLLMPSSAFDLSQLQGLFPWVVCSHQMTKILSFIFSISPSSEYSGLISLKIDWFDLLAVQGTLRILLQHHQFESISSLVFCLLYSPALTTVHDHWEDHSFDCITFVGRVMSLLFNTLSRFVIAFLPRSSCLLISWLKSLFAVILEPKKRKSVTNFHLFPFYLPCSNGVGCHDLSFFNI